MPGPVTILARERQPGAGQVSPIREQYVRLGAAPYAGSGSTYLRLSMIPTSFCHPRRSGD
jgi:hypothetical protein